MNAAGVIQTASDSVEQVFGWKPSELMGRNVKVLIPEPRRSDLDCYLDRYRRSDRGRARRRSHVFEAQRKDGSRLRIELSMSRAELPTAVGAYFIGFIRDMSGRIDVGDEGAARTAPQQRIIEQTRELVTANLRLLLADRLAALGTLAVGLGHDMNNVLLPVRARLDALERTEISPASKDHIAALRRSVAYLQHLTDGLHFVVGLESQGPASLDEGATDLALWWTQVGTLLRTLVPRHVTMTVSIPAGLPLVNIAPHWLTQAMLNLIANAGEAMSPRRRNARVRVWAKLDKNRRTVRLGVTDNGRGMTPAVQRRALDLFFTTKPRGMGTGLGLPLARKVALHAGGSIEIKSRSEQGTSIVLALPIAAGAVAPPALNRPTATVSILDHRSAALIVGALLKAGVVVKPEVRGGPNGADLWVTQATPAALPKAARWRRAKSTRTVVLAGAPAPQSERAWSELGALVIGRTDDAEAVGHTISRAVRNVKGDSHE